jgi:branched-chain amino acid transport system permease protein
MERIAFRPLRGAGVTTLLLSSFAVSIILQILFQNLISPRPRAVPIPSWLSGSIDLWGIQIGTIQIASAITAVVMLVALNGFLRRTVAGLSVRAAGENFVVTRLMGIRANRVVATAFAISGLLAGAAGVLWVAQRGSVDPAMGLLPVIKAFIAATIGGLGSLSGAVAGGFLLGAIEVLLQAYLPDGALPYRDALALLIVVGVIVFRPQGLIPRHQSA